MKQSLFIDANYFCALYNKQDALHQKAKRFSSELEQYYLATSNFVLLESYTVISQRSSKNIVVSFKKYVYSEGNYHIFWVDKGLEEETWKIFASIKDKNFSYVDASILALMKKEKISHLLSFDAGFAQFQKIFGFTLIPA